MMYVHYKKLNLEKSYSHQDLQLVQPDVSGGSDDVQ